MMKEVCAQCLQRQIDPKTGKETMVFTCFNQDQELDSVDFSHLRARDVLGLGLSAVICGSLLAGVSLTTDGGILCLVISNDIEIYNVDKIGTEIIIIKIEMALILLTILHVG
jgi:hypothetical protein